MISIRFIILIKRMYGLKNLVPKGVLHQQNYSILKKHSEEYRRSMSFFAGHLHQMIKIYIDYYQLCESNLNEFSAQIQNSEDVSPRFYIQTHSLFKCVNKELRTFIEKVSINQKSILDLNNLFITDYNALTENFQQKGKSYLSSQQNVLQTSKKYFNIYKSMLNKIESYKNSFVDVKLIYNNDQKIRLYLDCTNTYKKLEQLSKLIQFKVDQLNIEKLAFVQSYKILQKQLCNFTISFASRYIEQLRKFFQCLFQLERNRLQVFMSKVAGFQKHAFETIFETQLNLNNQNLITIEINPNECKIEPCFIVYRQRLRQEGVYRFKGAVLTYINQMSIKVERRKKVQKKMLDYFQKYFKGLEKSIIEWIRQTLQSFQKMRKRIGQAFGNRWISFYKIIAAIFENCIENTGRLLLRVNNKLQKIETSMHQQNNLLSDFLKEIKTFSQKFINKKIIKKYTNDKQNRNQELLAEQKATTLAQINQMSQFIKNQIVRYHEGCNGCNSVIKSCYYEVICDIKQSMAQYFTFFNEIKDTYYQEAEYAKSYSIFQDEMSQSVKRGMEFFRQIQLSVLVKETGKISFDNEFNKIEGFKKIKKPKQLEEENPRNGASVNITNGGSVQVANSKTYDPETTELKNEVSENLTNIIGKDNFLGDMNSRHAQFLLKKIMLDNTQKYIKSYSCSLSDMVILAGRLFITTNRLCFYSKFNSKNIFFGETFIDIPRGDIKKIDRRSMSLFSDNALAVTTINGQLIFRSFFSRDATYDLIRKTFQVNNEEIFFEEEELREGDSVVEKQIQFEDDMKEESGKQREVKILKQIKDFNYTFILEDEFVFPSLTVVRFLKMFQLDQEVVVNRTNFSSFVYYYKDSCEHKQINIEAWDPNPLQYLNVINVKEDSPQIYKRKITSLVPLPPSGIPFMPKSAATTEDQTMYLINKDKVVIETLVKNSGIPYCDTYNLIIKKVIQTSEQNKVKASVYLYVNFLENVMIKATIQSKTIESIRDGIKIQNDLTKQYLKTLQKKMQKAGRKQSPQEKIKQLEQQLDEVSLQAKKYKQESKQVHEQCSNLKQNLKFRGIIIIVLIVLVLLEFILLLS